LTEFGKDCLPWICPIHRPTILFNSYAFWVFFATDLALSVSIFPHLTRPTGPGMNTEYATVSKLTGDCA